MLLAVMGATKELKKGLGKPIYEALDNGLLILVNIKNHRVLYSLANRPDPNLTPVTDRLLATAIVEAGSKFTFGKRRQSGSHALTRDDGSTVQYKDAIEISWEARVFESTMRKKRTLQVLSIVVRNLMASAMKADAKANPHGAN